MILIIGGAYQGKLDYALEHYHQTAANVLACTTATAALCCPQPIINHLQLFILAQLQQGGDPLAYIRANAGLLRDKIILCEDLSCGVVPVDPLMRKWRESTGRCLAFLSAQADEVVRLFCGLPTQLK